MTSLLSIKELVRELNNSLEKGYSSIAMLDDDACDGYVIVKPDEFFEKVLVPLLTTHHKGLIQKIEDNRVKIWKDVGLQQGWNGALDQIINLLKE